MEKSKPKKKISRRDFMKIGGLVGGALSLFGIAGAGYSAGKDLDSHTGWGRDPHGKGQFFNRKPFRVNKPTYEQVGKPERIGYLDRLFKRIGEVSKAMHPREEGVEKWTFEKGIDALPYELKKYYSKHPESLQEFKETIENSKKQHKNWEKLSP